MVQAGDQTECKGQSRGKEKTDQSLTCDRLLESILIYKKKKKSSQVFVKLPGRKQLLLPQNWLC